MALKVNAVTKSTIKDFSKSFNSEKANLIAANASVKNGLLNAAIDYKALRKNELNFSIELKQGSITNQRASGRCWIFAGLNVFRFELMNKNNIADFELSQNYLFFWDKLEKANYYLESMLKLVDEPVDGRLYSWINMGPLGDGGQWDMIVNLVNKYGLCPKDAYPESANSVNSRFFVSYLTSKLREDAVALRKMVKAGKSDKEVQAAKQEMLNEVYRTLVIALGEPPLEFDFVAHTKDDKLIQEFGITPKQFFDKYVGMDLSDYASLINAPTEDKPFDKMYTVKFLGNVIEGQKISYLNLTMDKIKDAVVKQLKDGHPVWFGSDCGKYADRDSGTFDLDTVAMGDLLGFKYGFTKGDKLTYGDSAMNHAMVIQGVNLDEKGKPNRWKIENSWGGDAGRKGYFVASDKWFDEYVFQVVVNKKYLDKKSQKVLSEELNELEPWDPMGTLAD
ncbi:MAG: C1 family peptidase [Erysipelotrichaceae bacterium]|nr:C1 family peptidase [Erysipelotrichaceae bacterium]